MTSAGDKSNITSDGDKLKKVSAADEVKLTSASSTGDWKKQKNVEVVRGTMHM